jgi:FKBP-type peptidyl-prolyl cis-trans isomerase SlyD
MQVAKNKVVSIDYTLKNDEGEVIDSSEGQEPLFYLHGNQNIVPGLEKALEGKMSGDQVQVSLAPSEAYGERNDALQQVVPREAFQGIDALEVGMQFRAESNAGQQIVTITAIDGDEVTVDGNHPLAGETLNFDVTVVDVRDATEEELEHGHVHGPGGHHH